MFRYFDIFDLWDILIFEIPCRAVKQFLLPVSHIYCQPQDEYLKYTQTHVSPLVSIACHFDQFQMSVRNDCWTFSKFLSAVSNRSTKFSSERNHTSNLYFVLHRHDLKVQLFSMQNHVNRNKRYFVVQIWKKQSTARWICHCLSLLKVNII